MKPSVLVSSPDLRPSLLGILHGLVEHDLLCRLVTTIAFAPRGCVVQLGRGLPRRWSRGLDRRVLPEFLYSRVDCLPGREAVRLLASRLGGAILTHRIWQWAEISFDRTVARRYAGRCRAVYGMEHASLATFSAQKAKGGLCLLRQVNAHARTIAAVRQEQTARFPQYASAYSRLLAQETEITCRRKEAEYAAADLIVCNSEFVRESFLHAGVDGAKLAVVPTGCPMLPAQPARSGAGGNPLVYLFVGTLSLRKGVPDLIAAWQEFHPGAAAELWLAGAGELPEAVWRDVPGVRHLGILSRARLMQIYRKSDVFVLPTLCEGRAHAVLEALAAGLPVITTAASGCADIIHNGLNGRIMASGDAAALAQAMDACLEQRERLPEMGQRSRAYAAAWTVADADRAHVALIRDFLHQRGY